MRRRRQLLHVSTFPFLAVLLCTMGSLILVLLVIDRRAKQAALAREREAVAQVAAERAEEAAKARADWERRRAALHARLVDDDEALAEQMGAVQDRLQSAERSTGIVGEHARGLRDDVSVEERALRAKHEQLEAQRARIAEHAREKTAAQGELARLTAELADLERTLAELKALRKREEKTYSLVPYRGKRGDQRRPIYVECSARGVILHPDQRLLPTESTRVDEFRAALGECFSQQANKAPAAASPKEAADAYVLFLVRPDGISTYHRVLNALDGMTFDFGYEFVEQDWVLDFSEGDHALAAQPWMAGETRPRIEQRAVPNVTGRPRQGVRGTAMSSRPAEDGPGAGAAQPPTLGVPFAAGGGALGNSAGEWTRTGSAGHAGPGQPQIGTYTFSLPPSATGAPGGLTVVAPQPPGSSPGSTNLTPSFTPGGSPLPRVQGRGAPDGPGSGADRIDGNSRSDTDTLAKQFPPLVPTGSGPSGAAQERGGQPGASPGGSSASRESDPDHVPKLSTPLDRPPAQPQNRPLRFSGDRDWVIGVECTAEGISVPTANLHIPVGAILRGEARQTLLDGVAQLIARRQAMVRPGEYPYRPQVRFLVRPDGVDTYYRAYPLLEPLRLPMTRQNVESDRDTGSRSRN